MRQRVSLLSFWLLAQSMQCFFQPFIITVPNLELSQSNLDNVNPYLQVFTANIQSVLPMIAESKTCKTFQEVRLELLPPVDSQYERPKYALFLLFFFFNFILLLFFFLFSFFLYMSEYKSIIVILIIIRTMIIKNKFGFLL